MLGKILFSIILLAVNLATAQLCKHTNLSEKLEFDIRFTRIVKEEFNDSCIINVQVIDKNTKRLQQEIQVSSQFIFSSDYSDCNAVKSFSTNVNNDKEVSDNGSGDFIVMDLNFDGLEDLAIKSDSGGNGGPTYSFYIQNAKGEFVNDNYLTQTMEFFPLEVNKRKKRLTIYVHASAYNLRKTIFAYEPKSNSWKIIRSSLVDYDDCPNLTVVK